MTPTQAHLQGYDCGLNGPNTTNSHYTIFTTPELLAEWEKGKAIGTADRIKMVKDEIREERKERGESTVFKKLKQI